MTTLIEAMKQALEALEDSIDDVRDCLNQNLPHAGYARYDQRIKWYREQIAKHEEAITSLRQAIEQAEKQDRDAYERGFIDGMQKQMQSSVDKAVNSMSKREWVEVECPLCGEMAVAHTHPSLKKREWVGLTEEEREQATGWSVEHIEQTLKEKNT